MRGYTENTEAKRERTEGHRLAGKLRNRTEEYMNLRKNMREYFREVGINPPEHIRKAIGLK